jgi:succinyl-CoA synthetase beta subunit
MQAYLHQTMARWLHMNGAGLAMATMDIIKLYGENRPIPDIGGGAGSDSGSCPGILADPNVKAVLLISLWDHPRR